MPHESTLDRSNMEYNVVTDSPMATRSASLGLDPGMKEKLSKLPSQQMIRSSEITHTHDEDDEECESDDSFPLAGSVTEPLS